MADAEGGRKDDSKEKKGNEEKAETNYNHWEEAGNPSCSHGTVPPVSPFLQDPLRSLASTAVNCKQLSSLMQTGAPTTHSTFVTQRPCFLIQWQD